MPSVEETRAAWESKFEELRGLVASITPEQMSLPTENEGWTVRNLATHVAVGSDAIIPRMAPALAKGRGLLPIPVPIPGFLFTMIANRSNASDVKKHANASAADLVKAMEEAHEKSRRALDAVPSEGWSKQVNLPVMGRQDLHGFITRMNEHDREHAAALRKALGK